MTIANTPSSINLQSKLNFRFALKRSPKINFFCVEVNLPNLYLGTAIQPTPFISGPEPGHKVVHGALELTFLVDENFDNYYELHDWITGIGLEESFTKYAAMSTKNRMSGERIKSDGSIIVLNSSKQQNFTFDFYDMFPIEIGGVSFSTQGSDTEYLTCTSRFQFRNFKVNRP